jgi:hypothetical protein
MYAHGVGENNSGVVKDPLELRGGIDVSMREQVGLATHINRIEESKETRSTTHAHS